MEGVFFVRYLVVRSLLDVASSNTKFGFMRLDGSLMFDSLFDLFGLLPFWFASFWFA